MTRISEAELRERQRRIEATIAMASACHMSDTKWRKLFGILEQLRIFELRWKLIHDDRIIVQRGLPVLCEHSLGDPSIHPGLPYREIEWIEIPIPDSTRLVDALEGAGNFPFQKLDSGLRIVGYSWSS